MATLLETPWIEADSADIIEILRAPEALPLAGKNETFSVQGYICTTKRDNRQLVYAALYVKEIQRALIFAENDSATTDAGRKKSEEFLASLGFRLERINLKFSPAMREVILREIPVILSPEAAQKSLREKKKALAEWQRLLDEPEQTPEGAELSMPEWTQRKQAQDALAAAKKTAAGNLAAEQKIVQKIAILREIIDGYQEQGNAGNIASAERSECLQGQIAAMQKNTEEMGKRILLLEGDLATATAERNQAQQEKQLAGVLLTESRQQLAQSESAREREAEERKVSDLARREVEKRFLALQDTAKRMHEQLTIRKEEGDRLLKEKEAADLLVTELQRKLEKSEERIQAETTRLQTGDEKIAKKLTTTEEELSLAKERIATSEKERSQLARALEFAEKRLAEMASSPMRDETAPGDDERIKQLQNDLRQANERSEFLRLEIERLAAGKAAAENRLAEQEAGGKRPEPAPTPAAAVPASRSESTASPLRTEPPPHVVRRPPPADALFRVDWDLAAVPYNSPEEIREIRQTMNRVRLSLEGYPDQYCSVSLIINEIEGKKGIFIAFRLSSSNRVLVYVPITLPDSPAAFAATLKAAEKFIQVVGLDIEPVQLSKNKQQRAKTLEGISVLQHPPKDAGNS